MKKQVVIIASAWMLSIGSIKAQITLDFTVDSTIYGYYFYPTKISDNETKYVFLDTVNNTFSLYNLDLTPFLTNITPPDSIFDGLFFYHIMYITRSLFDCDSTNIEYLFSSQNAPGQPLWIARTDGTILFYADSAQGPYCLGCPGGTTLQRPVLNTENGAKLFIMKYSHPGITNISVYSLCGKLPNGSEEFEFKSHQASYIDVFPNPSAMQLNFAIMLPDNINNYELIILNSNSQEVMRERILKTEFSIDVGDYSSGTYYYSLASKNGVLQTGKFILTK
ncbi:MAG TPA: T9SS type A sorting domain-containing protein [Chitinophagales bacterium]|nr:T9SS type A sorting domain-containing protein [Chitinophagales bacterium]